MTIPSSFNVPRGLIMIAPIVAGVVGAHRPLVEVWNATYASNAEIEPVYSNQDCGPVVAYRDPIGAQPVIEGEVRDWSPENVALAVIGPTAAVSGTTGTHNVPGAIAVGEYVVLPETGISALTIEDDSVGLVKGTDYEEFDMIGGVIKFLTVQTGVVAFAYTYGAFTRVEIGGNETDEYEVVCIVKNVAGDCTGQKYRLWSCSINASGALDLLAAHDDRDPKPIALKFLANYNQTRKTAGESGYGEIIL